MASYRRKYVCKALNISYMDYGDLCAIVEGETIETPSEEWFRERREMRRLYGIAELLLTQVYFKQESSKGPYREYILSLIEGPKFDMRRLKKKKG